MVETEDGEWVLRDDLKLWIKAGQTVQVTGVPVGRYTVEELADDLAIEGYDLDGEASTLSLEVQVGTDVPAEAGLINAYQKVSEPEDVDATEEPAVPVARRGAKAPALRAGDGDDEEQEATLTDNLNLLFDASRSKLNGSPLVEGQEYEVWEGRPIALSLHFAQTETSQHGPYRDDRPLYYNLPTGVSMPPEYTGQTFKIDVGYDEDTGESIYLENNRIEYDGENNRLIVYWNINDAAGMDALDAAPEPEFTLDIDVVVGKDCTLIEFDPLPTIHIKQEPINNIEIEKTGAYNADTNQIDYTVITGRSVVRGLVVGNAWNYGRSSLEQRSPKPAVRAGRCPLPPKGLWGVARQVVPNAALG